LSEANPLCGTLVGRVTKRFVVILVRGLLVLNRCHALKMVEVEPDLLAIEYITDLGDETW
jgi:hypothetical protein